MSKVEEYLHKMYNNYIYIIIILMDTIHNKSYEVFLKNGKICVKYLFYYKIIIFIKKLIKNV